MFLLLPIKITMCGAYSSWAGPYPLDLSVSPVDNSGTPLIRPPLGQKKIGCINVVAVLMRAFLQENVWWFLPGSQKKGHSNEVAIRRGSTVSHWSSIIFNCGLISSVGRVLVC